MPEKNKALFTSNSDEWATPQELFDSLNKKRGFTLDPCASDENHKCEKYFTIENSGLRQSWEHEVVFVNPPYSCIGDWVDKCIEESENNGTEIILLVPARPDTKHFRKCFEKAYRVSFIHGRLKFGNSINSAPFPSVLFEFNKWHKDKMGIADCRVDLVDRLGNTLNAGNN